MKRQKIQQEYKTESDIEVAAIIIAAIIGTTMAVILALFITFLWLH